MIQKLKEWFYKFLGLFDREQVSCPQCHVKMNRASLDAASYGQRVPKRAYQCPVCNGVQIN